MSAQVYRYTFARTVRNEEIEAIIVFALVAVESLHGESQARLDAAHAFDDATRQCVIDASTRVGRDLNRLFTGLASRGFGPDSFRVERILRDVAA